MNQLLDQREQWRCNPSANSLIPWCTPGMEVSFTTEPLFTNYNHLHSSQQLQKGSPPLHFVSWVSYILHFTLVSRVGWLLTINSWLPCIICYINATCIVCYTAYAHVGAIQMCGQSSYVLERRCKTVAERA